MMSYLTACVIVYLTNTEPLQSGKNYMTQEFYFYVEALVVSHFLRDTFERQPTIMWSVETDAQWQ